MSFTLVAYKLGKGRYAFCYFKSLLIFHYVLFFFFFKLPISFLCIRLCILRMEDNGYLPKVSGLAVNNIFFISLAPSYSAKRHF